MKTKQALSTKHQRRYKFALGETVRHLTDKSAQPSEMLIVQREKIERLSHEGQSIWYSCRDANCHTHELIEEEIMRIKKQTIGFKNQAPSTKH
mgnify:CR=1 FL=1